MERRHPTAAVERIRGWRLLAGADPRSAVVPRGTGAPGAGEALAVRAEVDHEATVVARGTARPTAGQGFAGDPPSHLALASAAVGPGDLGADLDQVEHGLPIAPLGVPGATELGRLCGGLSARGRAVKGVRHRRHRPAAAPRACEAAADRGDGRAVGAVEVDDHVRERRAALRQDDHARAAAAVLGAVHRPLPAVAADRDQPRGAELDRAAAEHRIAQAAGEAADQRVGELRHLRREAGRAPLALAGAERLPAAEQRVLLRRERPTLLPRPPHRFRLRHVAGGARLLLAQRVVVLLVGLLLALPLLVALLLGPLLLGLLAQRARVLAELLGGGRTTLRHRGLHRQPEYRCADDPAERRYFHGRLLDGSPETAVCAARVSA